MAAPPPIHYDLIDLFRDQPEWFASETIPHLLAWLKDARSPVSFRVERAGGEVSRLELHWSAVELAARLPGLEAYVGRLVEGRSVQLEQVPQYGAYALAGVVAAVFLGRRVEALREWWPPDLLFDVTPDALRGVEAAGRSGKGFGGLRALSVEKAAGLGRAPDVAEAWLSLWCTLPKVSLFVKVLP